MCRGEVHLRNRIPVRMQRVVPLQTSGLLELRNEITDSDCNEIRWYHDSPIVLRRWGIYLFLQAGNDLKVPA